MDGFDRATGARSFPTRAARGRVRQPRIHPEAYVHPTAVVIGDVTIGRGASVWPLAVLRADVGPIVIGEEANVQDGCVLHTDPGSLTEVGARCTLGHRAVVHGARLGEDTLVGMGAVVLERARIGAGSLVAAGAVVREDAEFGPASLVAGVPAKLLRVDESLRERNRANAMRYVGYARSFGSA